MLVQVIGLERHAIQRAPNGVECDSCGLTVSWPRRDYSAAWQALQAEGWTESHCPQCQTGFSSSPDSKPLSKIAWIC